jgi:hypothetical protein
MPNLDDEKFEAHLASFRPLPPEPVPSFAQQQSPVRSFFLWRLGATAAVILALAVGFFPRRPSPRLAAPSALQNSAPRTIRNTATLLAQSPSFDEFVNQVPMSSAASPIASNQSAIAVLSKEKIKL